MISSVCVSISVGIIAGIQGVYGSKFVTSSVSLPMTSSEIFVLLAASSFGLSSSPLVFVFNPSALCLIWG